MALSPGQELSHFRILRELGRGGMGIVYQAVDTRLKRAVALKVLPPDLLHDPQRRLRFAREARAASALNHPNIVCIYEIDSASGVDFIAMEHIEDTRNSYVIKLHDLRTGKERDLLEARDRKVVYPSFSPDGERIAFFRQLDAGDSQVFTLDRNGGSVTQVTRTQGEQNIFPRWTPDGSSLYFFQVRPSPSLRKAPVGGGPALEIVPGWVFGSVRFPDIDPTGRYIVYEGTGEDGAPFSRIRDLETGADDGRTFRLGWTRWSRDGKFILGERRGEITLCPTGDGECRAVTRGRIPAWSGDGARIYFQRIGSASNGRELWSVARDGSGERKVAEMRSLPVIDPFYDISVKDEAVWVRFQPGDHTLWLLGLEP